MIRQLLLVACLFVPHALAAAELPRVVIALYDSRVDKRWRDSLPHQLAEMPLNHLGLVVEPHDVSKGLPDISARSDVRGVLDWSRQDRSDDPTALLAWAERVLDSGRKFVVVGYAGWENDAAGHATAPLRANRVWSRIGLRDEERFEDRTWRWRVTSADPMLWFERNVPPVLPSFPRTSVTGQGVSRLRLTANGGSTADLVVTSPSGGYATGSYAYAYDIDLQRKAWLIDPFAFFRESFATDDLPKPDITTLVGRRMYFSQVDGDGWRNVSLIDESPAQDNSTQKRRSIDLLRDRAIAPYPDLPVSIAPIAGDLDEAWCGDEAARDSLRRIAVLRQVEIAHHTWSHPLDWGFFDAADPVAKEAPLRRYYADCKKPGLPNAVGRLVDRAKARIYGDATELSAEVSGEGAVAPGAYATPRSYAVEDFSIDKELTGAKQLIEKISGRKIDLVQWSGNTLAYADAVRRAGAAGLANINGGDTRFDPEFDSVGWVSPVGRWVAPGLYQIYAAGSNENTFTDLFTDRFFGFRYTTRTFDRTETPRRLKPVDVYYHVYSADRAASLAALVSVLEWAKAQPLVPVATSNFARIAQGFYTAKLTALENGRWRIDNRGALQTIRFDRPGAVDLARSAGVLGWRVQGDALYVALDPAVAAPVVALTQTASGNDTSLVESRWPIEALVRAPGSATFRAAGYGAGSMRWSVPSAPRWRVRVNGQELSVVTRAADNTIAFELSASADPVAVELVAEQVR
ncbi:hypothetical protein [Roseiterribacter gracilis]|uniref:NodB homology domain-containing protein n=1 Tax=Roseiterribacter gracilis TaxID=2812848 RepID=A0A8S8XJI8_9PROT|nr:hypothetical protein TMPK1_41040 [Rhodospirillales bacterium TMPK1]